MLLTWSSVVCLTGHEVQILALKSPTIYGESTLQFCVIINCCLVIKMNLACNGPESIL